MLMTKEDKKEATTAAAAGKKDQAKDKRARNITALVTTGSEILQRLEQLGPYEMLRPKVDELHALLVNAYLQGSISKPNKKGLEKANLLPNVQAAIGRFLAVATVSTPPLLLIPEVPSFCEVTICYVCSMR